ncbi:MAG TPA: ABC transporter ATP-binding protein [Rhizobiaceae bacterium]|nr:ABC transporter ATP-binding protein [Rhizobiaceae bacterium]
MLADPHKTSGPEVEPRQPMLSVENLSTHFFSRDGVMKVVDDVSYKIAPGETLAVAGESGSGKSVTALSILGLLPKPAGRVVGGRILLDGRDLVPLSEGEMQHVRGNEVAMIFQEPMTSLNPVLTVGDQIAEVLIRHRRLSRKAAFERVREMLELVRIPDSARRINDYPHEMSGGMRQRVMIAMALACKPKLLVADEPTTALDVTIQAQIIELIKTLQQEEGMSVLFITHDMGVVAEVADRTAVMYNGKVVEQGATRDIFDNPQHPYTRSLLSAVPRLGAMAGHRRPMRFPVVDRATGLSDIPAETGETVSPGQPVIEVKNLTARFNLRGGLFSSVRRRVHAVENVSFSVQPGETLSLVGESGCGKSTTGRSVMRLMQPMRGSVLLDGEDLLKLDEEALYDRRRRIQMIFQDPYASLNPRMTVGEAIAEPLIVNRLASRADAHRKVGELLEQVGLRPEMARRYPHEFSGGQRQRICIARALSVEPKLIVADESVSALDVSVKAQVINLMLDLQERMKLAYLFISHDMAVVERVSHRVAVMYLGEIVEIGPREAIFGNPQHPYTKRLLAAVPVPDPARRFIRRPISNDEIRSPLRAVDYVPPERVWRDVSSGHSVMDWGPEWEARA